ARVYASALGVYEIKINGEKVGDTFFAPGWTNYNERIQYQTYQVEEMLNETNKIEIAVGNGWYKGMLGFTVKSNRHGDAVATIAEIHITYTDGTSEIVKTDEYWSVTTGVIRKSEIYMGETIDSCFQATEQNKVVQLPYDKELLIGQESEPVRIIKRLPAKELITTPKGEKVLDFGQNIAGFVELNVKGEKGQKITICH